MGPKRKIIFFEVVIFLILVPLQNASGEDGHVTEEPIAGDRAGAPPDNAAVARAAMCVFKDNCIDCHGGEKGKGGLSQILKNGVLKHLIDDPDPRRTYLVKRLMGADPNGFMPPQGNRLSAEEIAAVEAWIRAGQPEWDETADCRAIAQDKPPQTPILPEHVLDLVAHDIVLPAGGAPAFPGTQPNYRYFSFAHLANSDQAQVLDTYRAALFRLLNYLSANSEAVVPEPIGVGGLVYRVDINQLGWTPETFKAIKATDPYLQGDLIFKRSLLPKNDITRKAADWTVRADVFLTNASGGNLYKRIVGIPNTERELEALLNVDAQAELAALTRPEGGEKPVTRFGFTKSGTEANNRLIERHEFSDGRRRRFVYKGINFEGNTGEQNIFQRPLGGLPGARAYQHTDTDYIIENANGLHLYVTYNKPGEYEAEANAETGRKCMTCHSGGLVYTPDQMRSSLQARAHQFTPGEATVAARLYPGDEAARGRVERDNDTFVETMRKLGLPPSTDPLTTAKFKGDPVNASVFRFNETMTLAQAAAEAGTTPTELFNRIRTSPKLSDELGSLLVTDRTGRLTGTVRRDLFESLYEALMIATPK